MKNLELVETRIELGQELAKEMNEIMEAETIPYLYSIFQKNDPPTKKGGYSEFLMIGKLPRVCKAESLEHEKFEIACYPSIQGAFDEDKIKKLFGEEGKNRALSSLIRSIFSTCCYTLASAGYKDCQPEFKKQNGEHREYFREFLDNIKNKYGNIYSNLELTPITVFPCDSAGGICPCADEPDKYDSPDCCWSCSGSGIIPMRYGFVAYFKASLWVKCKKPEYESTTIELTERQKQGLKTNIPQGRL